MILICNNDIIFVLTLVLFDLNNMSYFLMHYNKNKGFCQAVMNKQFLLCHWYSNSLLGFLSAYFIFFTNLAFPNFYKITCANIELPANFLEIFGSVGNLSDFFMQE